MAWGRFWDRISLPSPGWPWNYSNHPKLSSPVLQLEVHVNTVRKFVKFESHVPEKWVSDYGAWKFSLFLANPWWMSEVSFISFAINKKQVTSTLSFLCRDSLILPCSIYLFPESKSAKIRKKYIFLQVLLPVFNNRKLNSLLH